MSRLARCALECAAAIGVGLLMSANVASAAPSATTTTIIPIYVTLALTPNSGPPGTAIRVELREVGGNCDALGGAFVEVTLTAAGGGPVLADAEGDLPLDLRVPADAAPGSYVVNGRCATDVTTIYRYQSVPFTVVAASVSSTEPPTTATSPTTSPTTSQIAATSTTLAAVGAADSGSDSSTSDPASGNPGSLPRTGGANTLILISALCVLLAGVVAALVGARSGRD